MNKSLKINTIFNVVKTCSSIIFPLITFPYISRVLMTENIGKINFSQSFVNYFSLIAGLGISTYAIRECAAAKDKNLSETAGELFSINLISTIVSYLLMIITLICFRKFDNYRTLIIIESTTILFATIGADWLNSAMEDFKYISIRTMLFQLISLILMFIFVKKVDDYYKYACISVLSASGANIANIIYRKRYCSIKFTFKIHWKKHLPPILSLFVMMLSQTIFNNVDITMLGIMTNDIEVGLYGTAYKLIRIVSQLVQSLSLVIIPRLSIYFAKNDFNQANIMLRKVLLFNLSLGLPIVTGIECIAEDVIYLVGGPGYEGAAIIVRILIISFMCSLIGGSFLGNAILIPMKKERYYMIVCLITAFVNIVLNALLIPNFHAVGAAIATAFNGFIIMVLLFFKIDSRIIISDKRSIIIAPLLGCLSIVVICKLCSYINQFVLRLGLSVCFSVLIYIFVLVVFKHDFVIEVSQLFKQRKRS